ncbi:MAG: DUF2608 domain-containing protein [Legionella sp.]|jgi:hypothetical protein
MRFIMLFICSLVIAPVQAKVINYQTDTFADVVKLYKDLPVDPKTTLMVFDLDDTLITMSQPLGSVGWWDWQYDMLKNGSDSDVLVTKDFQQLVRIQNILFQLVKMDVTDDYVLPLLTDAANQGSTLMGLTARGQEYLSATLMQLKDNNFVVNDKLMFRQSGLKILGAETSIAGTFKCPQFTREVIYQQGLMFLSGEDKGEALLCALANSKQTIKTIIFVDDTKRNIDSMDKTFKNRDDYQVLNVYYTRENAKEHEIQVNPEIQQQMSEQWTAIKKTLNDAIVHSYF